MAKLQTIAPVVVGTEAHLWLRMCLGFSFQLNNYAFISNSGNGLGKLSQARLSAAASFIEQTSVEFSSYARFVHVLTNEH